MSDFIDSLLKEMSLFEKIGQLNHINSSADTTGAGTGISDIEERISSGQVGSVAGGSEISRLRELQMIAVNESARGIPLLFTLDVIHGHRTIFPLPLGLASTWDETLIQRTARTAAAEAAASGIGLAWAPMLDISRDARWGRCAESPGEDPLIASMFAVAMIEGFQQKDLTEPGSVMATAKHFAGYGFAESGRDYNSADVGPFRMHNVVLPPFKTAVSAGVGAVMVGFHDLSGIPCTAHQELLRELLRKQWGFDGLIVSDYTAIRELIQHGVAATGKAAALLAFSAGVDIDLGSDLYAQYLPELVAEGSVAEVDIDAACRRVLRAKQKLGLFDKPYRGLDEEHCQAVVQTPKSRHLARTAAAQACVLLKNAGVLPLRRSDSVAVVGPLADSRTNMQGTWAVAARPADSVTVLEGLRAAVKGSHQISYAKGANIVDDPNVAARLNVFGETFVVDPRPADEMIAEAVDLAAQADVVIACVGEAKEHSGESSTRTDLCIPGQQRRLLRALKQTGKPLVLVTMSGRPVVLEWEDRHAEAIVHAWFGGSEAGNAIADVLFGDVNPSAKLTMTFPRSVGQCPIYYAESPTGRPIDSIGIDVNGDSETDNQGRHVFRKFTTACRLEGPHSPLYPFGYGLSYSTFEYSNLRVDQASLHGEKAVLTATVAVRNTSSLPGHEIVQLYIADPVATRSRPVRELKRFEKIYLEPDEERIVKFKITVADLQFYRAERLSVSQKVWESGEFVVQVGRNSRDFLETRVGWCR